jgi:arsenite-transporting ATPase
VSLLLMQVSCFQFAPPVLKSTPFKSWRTQSLPVQRGLSVAARSRAPRWDQCFQLYSLKSVVDEIVDAKEKQTIFVGGKGGVGKTTTSSALAVELAMRDLKVLIISTDPAHSLGDALDEDLRAGNGKPITMTDPLTAGRLDAVEISAEAALEDFRESLAGFDVDQLANSLGVSSDLLESLGLREFSSLLNSPPPGLDELVGLGNVMSDAADEYDVVVVDTAPTGHTLRLLALPQFLDGLFGKLIKLRMKLSGLTSTLQAFLGDAGARERAQTIDNAMDKLESFRLRISQLEKNLKDNSKTSFLVVTVPTKLAVDETRRLVTELTSQGIAVNNVVVNQCIGKTDGTLGLQQQHVTGCALGFLQRLFLFKTASDSEAMVKYYDRRRDGQMKWIEKIKEAAGRVSASDEYKSNGSPSPIEVVEFPFFDVELVGVPALGFVGARHIADNPAFDHLVSSNPGTDPKVVICGGKGGVGKSE